MTEVAKERLHVAAKRAALSKMGFATLRADSTGLHLQAQGHDISVSTQLSDAELEHWAGTVALSPVEKWAAAQSGVVELHLENDGARLVASGSELVLRCNPNLATVDLRPEDGAEIAWTSGIAEATRDVGYATAKGADAKSCCRFEPAEEGELNGWVLATDTYQMAIAEAPADVPLMNVPSDVARQVDSLMEAAPTALLTKGNHLQFTDSAGWVRFSLVLGDYPKWRGLFTTRHEARIEVDRDDLQRVVRTVDCLEPMTLLMSVENDRLQVSCKDAELGQAEADVAVKVERLGDTELPDRLEVALNTLRLKGALDFVQSDTIDIFLTHGRKPWAGFVFVAGEGRSAVVLPTVL